MYRDHSTQPSTSPPSRPSAQLLGAGERVLADTVAYAKQRKQFGREIGSYQAIKHQLADVRIALDFARPLVFGAAVDPTPRSVSAAKIQSADGGQPRGPRRPAGPRRDRLHRGVRPEPLAAPHPRAAVGVGHAGVPPRPAAHRSPGRPMTDLVPTREHTELASSVRTLLDKRSDSQAVRHAIEQPAGFDTDLWATLCEQIGVAALAIPEEHGGAGFTLAETHVVLEELGRALTPSPLLASVIAGAALLAAEHHEPLARIAEGAIATRRLVRHHRHPRRPRGRHLEGRRPPRLGLPGALRRHRRDPARRRRARRSRAVQRRPDGIGPDPHARVRHGPDPRLRRARLRRRRTRSRSPWTPRRP